MPNAEKQRVLIVEDNADANDSLAILVEMMGYEVAQALDGPSALSVAERFRPHVVFCDVGLPGMDGYEVVAALRERFSDSKLVVAALTGYSEERELRRAAQAGFDRHFVKPMDHADLEAFLGTVAPTVGGA